jgi:two-component system, chemotaxis family, chemotaxis protein CheY
VSAPDPSASRPQRSTILAVDDDVDLRESMQEILELEGYLVATASHGQHALDLLRKGEHPQLILLDLMMPVMNGAEFLVELRADPQLQDIPVLLVTAFADRAEGLPAQQVLRFRGLGLFIARRIAESHGGTLTVQSAPRAGATFTASLPLG